MTVAELFTSGRIVDLILALLVVEVLVALALRRHWGDAGRFADLVLHLASGAWLLLALRFALTRGWWGWIGLCLLGALASHVIHVVRLLRARERSAGRFSGG